MKITIAQLDISWENPRKNLERITEILKDVPGDSSLVILPEMFTTGFSMNAAELAEDYPGHTLEWMRSYSSSSEKALCGSFIARENGLFFNRFVLTSPREAPVVYDKRHLFSIGGEDSTFTPGNQRVLSRLDDIRIRPSICYDLRFPVWLRNRNDYDLLICTANWPASRREVWKTLLRARALENQCYVAGVNRIGADPEGNTYAGDSVIIDPRGNILAAAAEHKEALASAEISRRELEEFREKFPVWKDADEFEIT